MAINVISSMEHLILSWRCDMLTYFFKIFAYIAGFYFYLIVIALGYWTLPKKRLFSELALLVPYATLVNALLKNSYRIPRPQHHSQLIVPPDLYSFPSGDIQVATVFWGLILLQLKSVYARLLCLVPVIGIGISRVYLGVHRLQEVIAGFLIGVALLLLWEIKGRILILQPSSRNYLLISFGTLIYFMLISYDLLPGKILPLVLGSSFGFAFCWKELIDCSREPTPLMPALLLLGCTLLIFGILPTTEHELVSTFALSLKFCIIIVVNFKLIPMFLRRR